MPCWHLYVVRTVDGCLYTGIATDVQRRLGEHLSQGKKCARYLRAHKPRELAFSLPVGSRGLALKVERRFKKLPKASKERIVSAGHLAFDRESGKIDLPWCTGLRGRRNTRA